MVPESGKLGEESLSSEVRQQIESQFDQAAKETAKLVSVLLRYALRALVIVIVLLAIAFSLDYIQLRRNPNVFGSVIIRRYYAVTLKNKKTDFSSAEPETQTCVNAVFPHYGYYPCWYLQRHNVEEIDI